MNIFQLTTIGNFDSDLNVTSGLDWNEIVKALNVTVEGSLEDTEVYYQFESLNYSQLLDVKNRR